MRKGLGLSCIALVVLAAWGDVHACGDKFLMVGRGMKFSKAYASLNPGAILIYLPRTPRAALAGVDKMQKYLTDAGHQVTVVRDVSALDNALGDAGVDLLLTEAAEASRLKPRMAALPSRGTVVPLLDNQTKETREALQAEFGGSIRPSDKPKQYLVLVDHLMKTVVERRTRK